MAAQWTNTTDGGAVMVVNFNRNATPDLVATGDVCDFVVGVELAENTRADLFFTQKHPQLKSAHLKRTAEYDGSRRAA